MKKAPIASHVRVDPAQSSCITTESSHVGKNVCNPNCMIRVSQFGVGKTQSSGNVSSDKKQLREHSSSVSSSFSLMSPSGQNCCSGDHGKSDATIIVKKSVEKPPAPQRTVSLPAQAVTSHSTSKRYSCPTPVICNYPTPPSSSSSSSSCSSPPPVKTSVITGHDPLGWKLRPTSSSSSRRSPNKRLSLQNPLVVTIPDLKSYLASQHDPSTKPKPALRPKPPRRHSDSSALRSLALPLPAVTLQELRNVHLRPVVHLDDFDDVFDDEGDEKKHKNERNIQLRKVPPATLEKTTEATQIAQMFAEMHLRSVAASAKQEENVYAVVMKPKPKPRQPECSNLHDKQMRRCLNPSSDKERTTPRFPG